MEWSIGKADLVDTRDAVPQWLRPQDVEDGVALNDARSVRRRRIDAIDRDLAGLYLFVVVDHVRRHQADGVAERLQRTVVKPMQGGFKQSAAATVATASASGRGIPEECLCACRERDTEQGTTCPPPPIRVSRVPGRCVPCWDDRPA